MPWPDNERHRLLSGWCDGSLDATRLEHLDELIRTDPEFRLDYLAYMDLHAALASGLILRGTIPPEEPGRAGVGDPVLAGRPTVGRPPLGGTVRRPGPRTRLSAAVILACAVGAALGVGVANRPHTPRAPQVPAEATNESVAVLAKAVNAEWDASGLSARVGASLPPGRLKLYSGLVRLEFYCGATVVLEGPADLELLTTSKAFCRRGKLRASVPPQARGFTVGSPRVELVDLGTEFGMCVGEADMTEVHVFDGAVELQETGLNRRSTSPRRLTTGAILRVDGSGPPGPPRDAAETFVSVDELSARADVESRERLREWSGEIEALAGDSSLAVHYTFEGEGPGDRTLHDRSRWAGGPTDGTVIGCRRVDGRWPGKGALEFRRVGDRVRFNLPGEFESLSMMAWVRIDGLDNRFNSLMQTDGFEPGEPHWQLLEDGGVALGVQATYAPSYGNYRTRPLFGRDEMGQWTHLAVVYDRAGRAVTHYVNGRPAHREPTRFDIPLRVGPAEIGNWNPDGYFDKRPVRNWSGIIDEFMIYSRALGAAEVERHYSIGSPSRQPPPPESGPSRAPAPGPAA